MAGVDGENEGETMAEEAPEAPTDAKAEEPMLDPREELRVTCEADKELRHQCTNFFAAEWRSHATVSRSKTRSTRVVSSEAAKGGT